MREVIYHSRRIVRTLGIDAPTDTVGRSSCQPAASREADPGEVRATVGDEPTHAELDGEPRGRTPTNVAMTNMNSHEGSKRLRRTEAKHG
jgi:hypothetical protein